MLPFFFFFFTKNVSFLDCFYLKVTLFVLIVEVCDCKYSPSYSTSQNLQMITEAFNRPTYDSLLDSLFEPSGVFVSVVGKACTGQTVKHLHYSHCLHTT